MNLQDEIRQYYNGSSSALESAKFIYEYRDCAHIAIFPDVVYDSLAEEGLILDDKDKIWINTRCIAAVKNKYGKNRSVQRYKSWDENLMFVDLVRVFYINEVVQANDRAEIIAAKEIIRLFKGCEYYGHKMTVNDIVKETIKLTNKVIEREQNDTVEYNAALLPDSKSSRARKWKYSKSVLDKAELVFPRLDRENIPARLDKIILDAIIGHVWDNAKTDDDIINIVKNEYKVVFTRAKLYKWRKEYRPNEHKEHKEHEKSYNQKEKETKRLHAECNNIVNLKKEFGEEWKKHWDKRNENWCRRHQDEVTVRLVYLDDVKTVAEKINKANSINVKLDNSWYEAYMLMKNDVDEYIEDNL
jgi:hypothetical protein